VNSQHPRPRATSPVDLASRLTDPSSAGAPEKCQCTIMNTGGSNGRFLDYSA
jgi:hypothetical protein